MRSHKLTLNQVRPRRELRELRELTTPGPTLGQGRGNRDRDIALRGELPPLSSRPTLDEPETITIPPPPPALNIETYWYKPTVYYPQPDLFLEGNSSRCDTQCLECRELEQSAEQYTMADRESVTEGCPDCEVAGRNIRRLSILVLIFVTTTLGLALVIVFLLENQEVVASQLFKCWTRQINVGQSH